MTIPSIHTQHEHLHSAEHLWPAAATGTLLLCKNVGDRGEDTRTLNTAAGLGQATFTFYSLLNQ